MAMAAATATVETAAALTGAMATAVAASAIAAAALAEVVAAVAYNWARQQSKWRSIRENSLKAV